MASVDVVGIVGVVIASVEVGHAVELGSGSASNSIASTSAGVWGIGVATGVIPYLLSAVLLGTRLSRVCVEPGPYCANRAESCWQSSSAKCKLSNSLLS